MLLLVVLSLLVLFMLIGTAFLMSSNQYKTSADASARKDRVGNFPTELLDRALMQVLCDTGDPNSVIRNHSLLRDFYGTEGFEAIVYSPLDSDLNASFSTPVQQVTRYATEPTGPYEIPGPSYKSSNPTVGQLIDIYVRELAYKADDPLTETPNEASGTTVLNAPDARHILKLERSVIGLPEMFNMPLTKGYFNGCLLTITSGPAAGQSTRIVDYEYVGDMAPAIVAGRGTPVTAPFPLKDRTRLYRLRVMAFPNAEGNPMLQRKQLPTTDDRRIDPSDSLANSRGLEIADLVNATFIVNGRPFSGTGVGFNELAKSGEPRLNAVETVGVSNDTTKWLYPEIALTPNPTFFFAFDPFNSKTNDVWGARYPIPDPSSPTGVSYPALNPTGLTTDTTNVNVRPLLWKYQTFSGPGEADESYDAADSQNMFLALQTVTPRARGRVVHGRPDAPISYEIDSSEIIDSTGNYANTNSFLRLDLEDLPWPSFHRPDLENYWFHRLVNYAIAVDSASPDDAVRAVLTPYGTNAIRGDGDDPGVSLDVRDQIVAMKRKISLRPIREDHPGFDGSNPASRSPRLDESTGLVRNGNIAIPFWEATGPWDVDNDNDGVPDSVWVDLGEPVQQAEDGTLYKPLYAFLIVDLDSRLNVNAHGLVDHLRSPQLDSKIDLATGAGFGNLAHDIPLAVLGAATLYSSNFLPAGSGYGPAEISLRPLFSPNLPGNPNVIPDGSGRTYSSLIGNPAYDDYARIISGRPAIGDQPSVWGRHGSVNVRGNPAVDWTNNTLATREAIKVRPGIPYDVTNAATQSATLDRLTAFKFFGYPLWLSNYYDMNPFDAVKPPTFPSSFGQVPDLLGRYAVGLDYAGQPASEPYGDSFYTFASGDPDLSLLYDTPYELDLSDSRRRDTPDAAVASAISVSKTAALNDDAPFATADLERILRAHDADSGILPDRLWNLVDAFDPLKLRDNQPALVDAAALSTFGAAGRDERLAAAQQLAQVNRRLVTTDSYDVPVPTNNFLKRLIYGADGQPGAAGVDDDMSGGNPDDPGELGWRDSDDWYAVMYHEPTPENPTPFNAAGAPTPAAGIRLEPQNPTIVDQLRYRVQFERRKRGVPLYNETELTAVTQQLLAPEILAGGKMDLNRPFGDGRDSGDGLDNDGFNGIDDLGEMNYPVGDARRDPYLDGVVDDILEAGEPFVDSLTGPNQNGKRDPGEFFYNIIGGIGELTDDDAKYNGPRDVLWRNLATEVIGFSYNHGGVTTDGRLIDTGGPAGPDGRLRYNGLIQRQTYARQLYCLMMLLVDENYLASQNVTANAEGNPNLQSLYEDLWQQIAYEIAAQNGRAPVAPSLIPSPTKADYDAAAPIAQQLALRKLTARRIAQWAINAVDFRDSDASMTPFEYDENPFDGWGVFTRDPANPSDPPIFTPIDGDLATNENWGNVFPFPTRFDPTKPATGAGGTNPYDDATAQNAMRGVVWGVEKPELIVTETLAFHDRRCTDQSDPGTTPPNHSIRDTSVPLEERDLDLDQKLKPRGSLFVELYSPSSPDSGKPFEFYSQVPPNPSEGIVAPTLADGIMLNRLSNVGAYEPSTNEFKRSPVWRMSVVRDPIDGKLTNAMLAAADREALLSQVLTTDPDGFGFDTDGMSDRLVYFSSGGDLNRADDNDPSVEYQFDTVLNDFIPTGNNPNLRVRVPPVPLAITPTTNPFPRDPAARRYFIARTERAPGVRARDNDVPIAPILPGRYAVVGTSGIQLDVEGKSTFDDTRLAARPWQWGDRYVSPISRLYYNSGTFTGETYQPDGEFLAVESLRMTRRIELWPSPDPNQQQVLVGENGGPELVDTGAGVVNVFDSDARNPDARASVLVAGRPYTNRDGVPDSLIVEPSVAIPVEDMNTSEPVEGYPSRRYRAMYDKEYPSFPLIDQQAQLNNYGELEYPTPYNRPLDVEPETTMNGTTQNYRSVHLQRLANPMFPWNPPPLDENGRPNAMHRVGLPVNPYLSTDSQSTDLTAFNGATHLERADLPAASPVPITVPGGSSLPNEDLFQRNYMAPLSAIEYVDAPNHVLAGLLRELYRWNVLNPRSDRWVTVEELRSLGEKPINTYLTELERNKQGNVTARDELVGITQWRWHQVPRVLPDDFEESGRLAGYDEKLLLKRFHLKSLERGAHALALDENLHWQIAQNWLPRLLWKQERPNITLSLNHSEILSDLKNVRSRRVLTNDGTFDNPPENRLQNFDHYTSKDQQVYRYLGDLNSGAKKDIPRHVIDFVVEQTLGFTNESYAPKTDRAGGGTAKQAMLLRASTPKMGAPEIATMNLANPENGDLNKWNTVLAQNVATTPAQELARRQRLMQSTFPWLTWSDRPFVSADELFQVPASSSSLMLREYTVANQFTANPYDGDGREASTATGYELEIQRIQRQQGTFGHLLNLFHADAAPAGSAVVRDADDEDGDSNTTESITKLHGALNAYRILDFVEVPSRYVGTDTLLSPDIFNDVPVSLLYPTEPVGADITSLDDPRLLLQPPFNKVSRQRDPGRVNLNTVTGRRRADASGLVRHWSEVYDGIMHRYGDSNLMDPTVAAGNPAVALQLSHFGPAWRDVVLSRKGYAQFNADNVTNPIEKLVAMQVEPETFGFGLNPNYPSVFSNPFRSADAGDLVPLPQMMRPGVDTTLLRGHHWQRAQEDVLKTNPFASVSNLYPRMAWGIAGVDDDGNGIVDDIREAGWGVIDPDADLDGDSLRIKDSTKALESSGIPLFSEQVPEPAIDGERNPGMMYQPMTRLGNLVTTRSNVYAIWVTVGYFEVERAPDWNDPNASVKQNVRARFGATNNDGDPATIRGRALYDRVYPDGYTLGEELGTDTGSTNRQRAFYIIDRTEPVGFKPGEPLNVDKMIRVRRRIE